MSSAFCDSLRQVLLEHADKHEASRHSCGLTDDQLGDPFLEYICGLKAPTAQQLQRFIAEALAQYAAKVSEPSTPLGAIAAQVQLLHIQSDMMLWDMRVYYASSRECMSAAAAACCTEGVCPRNASSRQSPSCVS